MATVILTAGLRRTKIATMWRAILILVATLSAMGPSAAHALDPYERPAQRRATSPDSTKVKPWTPADSAAYANWKDPHIDDALGWTGVALAAVGTIIRVSKDPGQEVVLFGQVVEVNKPDYTDANVCMVVGGAFILAGLIVHENEPRKPPKPVRVSLDSRGVAVAVAF